MDDQAAIDPQLLDALLRARGPVSTARLRKDLTRSTSQLNQEFDRLRAAGCRVEIDPAGHARLTASGLGAWVDYLKWRGPGRGGVEVYQRTSSTQDAARRLIAARGGDAHAALVAADEQTAGRGRLGRHWVAPPGTAALFSVVWIVDSLRGNLTTDRLLFAVAVAVCEAIEAVGGPHVPDLRIRWPNDVLIEGCKVAGILVESSSLTSDDRANGSLAAIIGIGVNVGLTQQHIRDHMSELDDITSLAMCGVTADRLLVIAEIIEHMDRAMQEQDTATLLDRWRRRSTVLDRCVSIVHDGQTVRGQVVDLDPHEGLIVRTDEGQLRHFSAQTSTIVS